MTKKEKRLSASAFDARCLEHTRKFEKAMSELRQAISELRRLSASLDLSGQIQHSKPRGTKGKSKPFRGPAREA